MPQSIKERNVNITKANSRAYVQLFNTRLARSKGRNDLIENGFKGLGL